MKTIISIRKKLRGGALVKKTKLIAGILLMILGVGVSIGSVAFRFYEHNRFGMNTGQRILKQDIKTLLFE